MDAINPTSTTSGSESASVDYDESYTFGRRPNVQAPWPFTERQFARLLIARGKYRMSPSIDDTADSEDESAQS
jgi:hypothetical protein